MLGKLMKYELRSMLRLFWPIWVGVIAVAGVERFMLRVDVMRKLFYGIPSTLLMIVYVLGVLAMTVVALVFMIQRFYVGLLKDEGYLMFTLPVKTSALIWSKGLSATLLVFLSGLVSAVSVAILLVDKQVMEGVRREIYQFKMQIPDFQSLATLAIILGVVLIVVSVLKFVLQTYLSMAIGQLGSKHKGGLSVLAYLGITWILGTIGVITMTSAEASGWLTKILPSLQMVNGTILTQGNVWLFYGFLFLLTGLQIVLFYFPAQILLSHKLNLE